MSAVAASAAVLPRPRTQFAGGASRRRLRSVPAQAGPVARLELGNPLQLTKTMRARLLAAVRALVTSPALAGASDGTRLASVVLTAKADARRDFETSIWAEELGRWLGVSQSTVAHTVLPELRGAGFLGSNVATNAIGWATGLECWVIPMYRAQQAGDRRHALALSRSELAVLLSLITVLFGPGWEPKDKAPIPAGLLAGRTGRGAATDRLGLLLMVLTTGSAGWLQLCPGSVDTGRGRPAATVARLLGCTAAAGAKVLKRLQEHGVADVVRRETRSGLHAQSRVRLVPVAKAHGVAVREARRVVNAVFSDLAGTASGDVESGETAGAIVATGVEGAGQDGITGSADLAATAQHHALHASGVTPVVPPQLSCGFSGEGRGGEGRRPERVCAGEDQAVDCGTDSAGSGSPVAEGGPLRGEKPKESPVEKRVVQRAAGAGAGGRPKAGGWEKAQQQRRVSLPDDLRLRVALAPVSWLWSQLNGWQQDQVEAAATTELAQLAGLGVAPEGASRMLADRLTDRLAETGGEAMVTGPYAWLIRRGLPQRPACSHRKCDDGIRLDTGEACENCGNVIHLRRARRARIGADIDRELPGLADGERRRVLEERLREQVAIEAEDLMWRQAQARAEKAEREAARGADQERAERERAAAAVAEVVRQALACEDCGQPQAGGLCEPCGYERRTEALTVEAGMVAATWAADLEDQAAIEAVAADVRASLTDDIERTRRVFLASAPLGELDADPIGAASVLAFGALRAVEEALVEFRRSALGRLARTEEADAEARRAYKTEQGRRWFRHNPSGADAIAAATKAADTARERAAECLLATRLGRLREQAAAGTRQAASAPWTDRLPEFAGRPLTDDIAEEVIV
ncbi:hypothetical protein CG740_34510 [Streptomyces sp. CB01201]|uniref:hypothetical protein n=1 Tax=Streptomyces sp. CB01201 TaxID=2020324 RepID=UPI000C27B031|nr:hypothetical protein [Streptomyces sp. CB01201]PJM98565.1 hypothetical protein CG740_34510 [Streptomyces sp. CB01201]